MRSIPARLLALLLLPPVVVATTQVSGDLPERAAAAPSPLPLTAIDVAFASAEATGERVEIAEEGDEYTRVFADPAGTVTTELSSVPTRVRNDAGAWVTVDYTLRHEGGRVVPVAGNVALSFSDGGDADLADLASDGEDLSLDWPTTRATSSTTFSSTWM